ncbi:helix-turn-helix domain-containing protein [Demequina sp. NBRC 110054]|uniref:helix-turn-helix domain-containing protein n=1 Tax=Demequina sp. NBRC 110054 TaxID=1570343 RepID=UPI000A03FA90|nr:helix-turn-helix domain-containing protein [Demequina sp. NBRC 110054]
MPSKALSNLSAPDLLTRAEAAAYVRVHVATLDKWIVAGTLPATKIGRRVLIRRHTLDALIERATGTATSGPLAGFKA